MKQTRGSSYLPLSDWISSKKVAINPKNEEDEECFKWAVIVALHHERIGQSVANIETYEVRGQLQFKRIRISRPPQ